ncbi:nucleoside deaminase [Bacillus sp. MHSD_36]|uniref:Nucleoside deaminase n=1 Tax=Bacillus cereus TaxID=1396 RepID=A0A9X8IU26_BACCE|nr:MULTISPECIES: nucleoside deaminase [Bacillus]MCX2700672.1 nucleoside deaminase [Bacillus sp. AS_5]KAB7684373.1 nucleoside deaminase [Bacillus sp. B1-WWTP-T-0.5-Post-4]MCW4655060.1 nucleoside deaminase [Bacillus sp. AS_3]MDP7992663.1 nucleoside deaminase [Bacillus sp. MHSD_36]MDR4981538.1 nucleoside deaminase [Bacillus sp. MHSD_37]
MSHKEFMKLAIDLAYNNTKNEKGKPFGAVLVKDGEIVAKGVNEVLTTHDPTAHAELLTIREACRILSTSDLSDCILYASGEPCPMCLSAIYWANLKHVYYSYTSQEEEEIGLGTKYVYQQIALPKEQRDIKLLKIDKSHYEKNPFALWKEKNK